MAYGGGMGYHLHMPSYFWRTFTEYPNIRFRPQADHPSEAFITEGLAFFIRTIRQTFNKPHSFGSGIGQSLSPWRTIHNLQFK